MEDPQAVILASLAVIFIAYIVRWRTNPLNAIPTVGGPSAPILSYWGALSFFSNGRDLLAEGYKKFHGSVFKVAMLDRWLIVVSGTKLVDELRKRPDEELSFVEAAEDSLQIKYTLGREPLDDPYHVDIIRDRLMRTLPVVLPDVIDELRVAVPDFIHASTNDDWVTVNGLKTMQQIVARVSNRVFVGLPACRDQKYLDIAIAFTIDIIKDSVVIQFLPQALRAPLVPYLSSTKRSIRRAIPYLKFMIQARKAKMEEYGDNWPDRPNDMLQWILEEAVLRRSSDERIVERILLVNFAAIHTSSNTITHALFDLAAHPKCIQPLRDEIESIVAAEGWTKAAMGKMRKVDSFLRESQRYHGIGLTSMGRKAMKDVTLSDGTFLPAGSVVVAASDATHHDDAIYANADVFDPFRFAHMREAEGEGTKHQFVNTSLDYIPFGHGRHACPGRFFAANELKAMLAYIAVNYDLKLAGDGTRPTNVYFNTTVVPNPSGQLMFRKRQVSV